MKNREQIITDMCYTWRHDYGLIKESLEVDSISSGMTDSERKMLWNAMAHVFDRNIAPLLKQITQEKISDSRNICDND